jgi:uncharacterized membrane protein YjjP (DUF1212 family)/uncharacterized membrane protein YjjB (DUF3815 family)
VSDPSDRGSADAGDRRTADPKDRRSAEAKDRRTADPKDRRAASPKERRTPAPKERRSRILRGDLPTEPMPMMDLLRRTPYRHARIPEAAAEDTATRNAVELAVRVGELMLRCGAGAPQVEGAVAAVAAAGGVDVVDLDITMQSLLVQAHSSDGRTHTVLRVVRRTRYDYGRLVAVHRLVAALVAGDVTPDEAAEQLRAIKRHPRNYPVWAVSVASAMLASAVAVMIGASLLAATVTIVVVLGVAGIGQLLGRIDLPEFYVNAINSFVATMSAGAFFAAGSTGVIDITGTDFAYIVAGGIVAMLPGRTMASAIEDVLFGYPLTGAGRLLGVSLSLTGLVIGIAGGLSMMLAITEVLATDFVPPSVLDLRVSQAPIVPGLIGALVVGLAAAVTVQSRRMLVLPTGLLTVAGAAVAALLTRGAGIGIITATGLAAVAIGVVGRVVAQRLHAPSLVLVVPASFGLLPGLTIFRGLYELVASSSDPGLLSIQAGITTLLGAGAVLLAIATGTVFGEILASPFDRRYRGEPSRTVSG